MSYTQIIEIDAAGDAEGLQDLLAGWDAEQRGVAPGYIGARLLADAATAGRYLIEVDFTSQEEADRNNGREETAAWASTLRELARGEPTYRDFEQVYATAL
jgi:quinol monooxygenase YgiN